VRLSGENYKFPYYMQRECIICDLTFRHTSSGITLAYEIRLSLFINSLKEQEKGKWCLIKRETGFRLSNYCHTGCYHQHMPIIQKKNRFMWGGNSNT